MKEPVFKGSCTAMITPFTETTPSTVLIPEVRALSSRMGASELKSTSAQVCPIALRISALKPEAMLTATIITKEEMAVAQTDTFPLKRSFRDMKEAAPTILLPEGSFQSMGREATIFPA